MSYVPYAGLYSFLRLFHQADLNTKDSGTQERAGTGL
jgi:hypothetical protein